jgi:hypothetical protein
MKKIICLICSVLLALSFVTAGFAASVTDNEHGILKLDRKNSAALPDNFRTSDDAFIHTLPGGHLPSREGMEKLHISGSQAFSEQQYLTVLQHIPAAPDKIYDIDLRGESHGYINGNAVSWYKPDDWGNKGRAHNEIVSSERQMLAEIAELPFINVGVLGDDKKIVPDKYYAWPVESALTEQQMTAKCGTRYLRLTLTDHLTPKHLEVDRFIRFYKTVPEDAWLHFHCFAGKGRTTTFMVMYDMLKNADRVSFDDIVLRQYAIGGIDLEAYDPAKPLWRQQAVSDRIEFLKNFYRYVEENPALEKSWTRWCKENNLPLATE